MQPAAASGLLRVWRPAAGRGASAAAAASGACSSSTPLLEASLPPRWQHGAGWRCCASSPQQQQQQQPAAGQEASAASSSSSSTASAPNEDGFTPAYAGAFCRPHKHLKYASLLNTFASFAAAPYILSMADTSPVARVAASVSILAFAIITTAGLHLFTSPYVHQLQYNAATDTVRLATLSFLGGQRWASFPVAAAEPPASVHPLSTFRVGRRHYYVDPAAWAGGPELLERLAPGAAAAAAAGPGGGDEQQPGEQEQEQQQPDGDEQQQQQQQQQQEDKGVR